MYAVRYEDKLAVRLVIGEEVHAGLLEACRRYGVTGAFVHSGIGMLNDPELGFFVERGRYEKQVFPGRHELLNLSGNVSLKDGELMAHLHAMLADEQYHVFGGHLFAAKVGMTLEVELSVVGAPVKMYRVLDPESGLPGLVIEED